MRPMQPRALGVDPSITKGLVFAWRAPTNLWQVHRTTSYDREHDTLDIVATRNILQRAVADGVCAVYYEMPMKHHGVKTVVRLAECMGQFKLMRALYTPNLPMFVVYPSTWRAHFKLPGNENVKARCVMLAAQITNITLDQKNDDDIAEAILLSEYGSYHYAKENHNAVQQL